jgi:glutamate-1-semialdehyde 2,1-aminomutase
MSQTSAEAHTALGFDPHHTQASHDWFERAKRVLAGGISSSARASTTGDLPYPLYITRGDGPYIWDADGNQFVDLLLSYGSAILGHADAGLCDAVSHQLRLGTMYGTCNTVEVELAEQICRMYPGAQLVRYSNSGSEAIMGAVRAARGFTGKSKILKFEGHYHGWVDVLAVSNRPAPSESGPLNAPLSQAHSRGMPSGVVDDVIICPWNSPEILKDILDRHDGQIAAIIAEPIVANNACIMPRDGYLAFLREQCTKRGILLIFDEIVTGFRIHSGGAAGLFGVVPDLAVFSKAIGGGLPISAFAGSKPVMDPVAANTVKHGGTYNGNPLCAASALYTLRKLNDPAVQKRISESGQAIKEAVRRSAQDRHIGCIVQGPGSMFQVVFTDDPRPLSHYRDLARADVKKFAAFRQSLLEHGVFINSSGLACWFISAAHGPDQVLAAQTAIDAAMDTIKN